MQIYEKSKAKIYQLLIQKMLPTTIEELESYMNKKTCYICWEEFDYINTKFQKWKSFTILYENIEMELICIIKIQLASFKIVVSKVQRLYICFSVLIYKHLLKSNKNNMKKLKRLSNTAWNLSIVADLF